MSKFPVLQKLTHLCFFCCFVKLWRRFQAHHREYRTFYEPLQSGSLDTFLATSSWKMTQKQRASPYTPTCECHDLESHLLPPGRGPVPSKAHNHLLRRFAWHVREQLPIPLRNVRWSQGWSLQHFLSSSGPPHVRDDWCPTWTLLFGQWHGLTCRRHLQRRCSSNNPLHQWSKAHSRDREPPEVSSIHIG